MANLQGLELWDEGGLAIDARVHGFRADWDGTTGTDNTSFLQQAIDRAIAEGVRRILIPAGEALVEGGISVSGLGPMGLVIAGAGRRTTTLICTNSFGTALDFGAPDDEFQYNVHLRDLTLFGPGRVGLPHGTSRGLHLRLLQRPWDVQNLLIAEFYQGLYVGIHSDLGVVYNTHFAYCERGAEVVGLHSDYIRFLGCSTYEYLEYGYLISSQRTDLVHSFIGNPGSDTAIGVQITQTDSLPGDAGIGSVGAGSFADGIGSRVVHCQFERGANQTVPFLRLGEPGGAGKLYGMQILHNRFGQNQSALARQIEVHRHTSNMQILGNEFVGCTIPAIWINTGMAHDIRLDPDQPSLAGLLGPESLGAVAWRGEKPTAGRWQQVRRFPVSGAFATLNGDFLEWVEDEVRSRSGCLDAAALTALDGVAALTERGVRWNVTGDGSVWEFHVGVLRDEAAPAQLHLVVRRISDGGSVSDVTLRGESTWQDYRVAVYLEDGVDYFVALLSRDVGTVYHTPLLVSTKDRHADLALSPAGVVSYDTGGRPHQASLPQGAVWRVGTGVLSDPAYGLVLNRVDTTATVELLGSGAASSVISVADASGVAVGDYLRAQLDVGTARWRMLVPGPGYQVTAVAGNDVTVTPGIPTGQNLRVGRRVQIYRYAKGPAPTAW